MLTNQTMDQLIKMKLSGMSDAYRQQLDNPEILALNFDERFGMIVEKEYLSRQNRQVQRLLAGARLKLPACIEDIDYLKPRDIDRNTIARLSTCQWIQLHQNVVVIGPTGVGKTYISCALGNLACRNGISTRYYRISKLLSEISMSRGDGSYVNLLNMLRKVKLLILDDWGIGRFTAMESQEILEVIEDRTGSTSTIIVSQIPLEYWHDFLTDPTIADAILDRLVHNAHKIKINGDSMRKIQGEKELT